VRRWRADGPLPPLASAVAGVPAGNEGRGRWPGLRGGHAIRTRAPVTSLVAHGAAIVALVLAGTSAALPPAVPELSVGMMFVAAEPVASAADAPSAPAPAEVSPPEPPPPQSVPQPVPAPDAPEPQPVPKPVAKPPAKPAPPHAAPPRQAAQPTVAPSAAHAGPSDVTPTPAVPIGPAAAAPAGPRLLGGMSGKCLADYPEPLRRRAVEGKVMIRVAIAADGAPGTASVIASSGSAELDRLALEAVRVCRYFPKANEAYVADVPYNFRLTD